MRYANCLICSSLHIKCQPSPPLAATSTMSSSAAPGSFLPSHPPPPLPPTTTAQILRGNLPPQVAMTPAMMIPSPLASACPDAIAIAAAVIACVLLEAWAHTPLVADVKAVHAQEAGRGGKGKKSKVPGRIRPRHCRPDAESHGPGPALVRGMARQPPAPRERDGRAVIAGPLLQACRRGHGRSILLGHGMAPGGARYANRLEGLVRLARNWWELCVVVCGLSSSSLCVEACACCDAHTLFARICVHRHHQCVQS
jgi:hypothetical protein